MLDICPSSRRRVNARGITFASTAHSWRPNPHAPTPQVKEKNPEFKMGDIAKELGAMWRALSAEEKEPYEEMARKDKERYEKEKGK